MCKLYLLDELIKLCSIVNDRDECGCACNHCEYASKEMFQNFDIDDYNYEVQKRIKYENENKVELMSDINKVKIKVEIDNYTILNRNEAILFLNQDMDNLERFFQNDSLIVVLFYENKSTILFSAITHENNNIGNIDVWIENDLKECLDICEISKVTGGFYESL